MSSAPLRVFLNSEEDRTLWELSKAEKIDVRTKERSEVIRLSSKGWKVKKIAEYMRCAEETVRRTIHRWKSKGLGGLYSRKRSGRKKKWKEEDLKIVEEKLEKDEKCYNSRQLCQILKKERKIELSERQMRRILKKKIIYGSERKFH
jgi:transposase